MIIPVDKIKGVIFLLFIVPAGGSGQSLDLVLEHKYPPPHFFKIRGALTLRDPNKTSFLTLRGILQRAPSYPTCPILTPFSNPAGQIKLFKL